MGLNGCLCFGLLCTAQYWAQNWMCTDHHVIFMQGYNTDHGAYYYYTTADFPNYLEALLAVNEYANDVGIPYRHILLDSWWYWKGTGDGECIA